MLEEDINIIVNSIIKFADFQNNRDKDYIFDPLKFSRKILLARFKIYNQSFFFSSSSTLLILLF